MLQVRVLVARPVQRLSGCVLLRLRVPRENLEMKWISHYIISIAISLCDKLK